MLDNRGCWCPPSQGAGWQDAPGREESDRAHRPQESGPRGLTWSPLWGGLRGKRGPSDFAEKRKLAGSCSEQGLSLCKSPGYLLLGICPPDAFPLVSMLEGGYRWHFHLTKKTGKTQEVHPCSGKARGKERDGAKCTAGTGAGHTAGAMARRKAVLLCELCAALPSFHSFQKHLRTCARTCTGCF